MLRKGDGVVAVQSGFRNAGEADKPFGFAFSRDRLAFSKSILKRYIRECVQRDALIASPWIVKPGIALQFKIPQSQSAASLENNKKIREGKLAKRRKVHLSFLAAQSGS